jgi:hypothetical protein
MVTFAHAPLERMDSPFQGNASVIITCALLRTWRNIKTLLTYRNTVGRLGLGLLALALTLGQDHLDRFLRLAF